ncbi:hypothetical protein BJ165DRAFT_1410046 [Panaeolus papilionaceus]|nr:hypothetical protein BJ165DRAFT_1410046 [Panaeolus papilionaceus]
MTLALPLAYELNSDLLMYWIQKEMPIFERYQQAWPMVEIIQSLIKNRRHTFALKHKTNEGEGKGAEQVSEKADGDNKDDSSDEEDEDGDGDGVVGQGQRAEDDDEDRQEEGDARDDEVAQPPDVDDNNDDDDDEEMDVAAPTNANGIYHYSQEDMDNDVMEHPPSPIQAEDNQGMQEAINQLRKKRKAAQAQLMEMGCETKRKL